MVFTLGVAIQKSSAYAKALADERELDTLTAVRTGLEQV